jgi:hypothetical protein
MGWFGKPSHQKSISTMMDLFARLYDQTTDGKSGNCPKLKAKDSHLRYLLFCAATTYVACADQAGNTPTLVNDFTHRVINTAIQVDPEKMLGGPLTNPQETATQAWKYFQDYLEQWSVIIGMMPHNQPGAGGLLAGMIYHTESDGSPSSEDTERLFQMSKWFMVTLSDLSREFKRQT